MKIEIGDITLSLLEPKEDKQYLVLDIKYDGSQAQIYLDFDKTDELLHCVGLVRSRMWDPSKGYKIGITEDGD